jgi:ferredoxin
MISRPSGTYSLLPTFPALKRWAIVALALRGGLAIARSASYQPCLALLLGREPRYNRTMPPAPGAAKAVGMVPDELKWEPKSKGLTTPRKKKPKELAVITECCTGCAGSPACVEYCPVEDCMFWVPDEDSTPFGRIAIDPILCIGCKKCLSKGPDGCFLDGCPWDAIAMVDIVEVEKEVGPMAI